MPEQPGRTLSFTPFSSAEMSTRFQILSLDELSPVQLLFDRSLMMIIAPRSLKSTVGSFPTFPTFPAIRLFRFVYPV